MVRCPATSLGAEMENVVRWCTKPGVRLKRPAIAIGKEKRSTWTSKNSNMEGVSVSWQID